MIKFDHNIEKSIAEVLLLPEPLVELRTSWVAGMTALKLRTGELNDENYFKDVEVGHVLQFLLGVFRRKKYGFLKYLLANSDERVILSFLKGSRAPGYADTSGDLGQSCLGLLLSVKQYITSASKEFLRLYCTLCIGYKDFAEVMALELRIEPAADFRREVYTEILKLVGSKDISETFWLQIVDALFEPVAGFGEATQTEKLIVACGVHRKRLLSTKYFQEQLARNYFYGQMEQTVEERVSLLFRTLQLLEVEIHTYTKVREAMESLESKT